MLESDVVTKISIISAIKAIESMLKVAKPDELSQSIVDDLQSASSDAAIILNSQEE